MSARLSYDSITLSTFTRASWRKWDADPLSDLVTSWRCTDATEVALPHGTATVYAGYAKDYAACPSRPPDVFLAEAHLGRVVIGIDIPVCELCIEAGRRGAYYLERREMALIARSLRLRRPPASRAG